MTDKQGLIKKWAGEVLLRHDTTPDSSEWRTPPDLWHFLNGLYRFDLDAAATEANALCDKFYTKEMDALSLPWPGRVFCNPPYGRDISRWVKHAKGQAVSNPSNSFAVLLLPARTDTKWFHEYIWQDFSAQAYTQLFLLPGRLKFLRPDGTTANSATFPSMIVEFSRVNRI